MKLKIVLILALLSLSFYSNAQSDSLKVRNYIGISSAVNWQGFYGVVIQAKGRYGYNLWKQSSAGVNLLASTNLRAQNILGGGFFLRYNFLNTRIQPVVECDLQYFYRYGDLYETGKMYQINFRDNIIIASALAGFCYKFTEKIDVEILFRGYGWKKIYRKHLEEPKIEYELEYFGFNESFLPSRFDTRVCVKF